MSTTQPCMLDGPESPGRLVLGEPGLLVMDGPVSGPVFEQLHDEVRGAEFREVHAKGWDRVWRLTDGRPLRGPSVVYDPSRAHALAGRRYPTHCAVDELIGRVRALARAHVDIAGVEGREWDGLYLAPWLYPPDSALSTHWDAGRYTGSFTFFVHRTWGVHWGGELIVPHAHRELDHARREGLDREVLDPAQWELGVDGSGLDPFALSTAITPRPNRLVLLGGSRPHRVARVDRNAGPHVRMSIAGFFLRKAGGAHAL